MKQDIKSFIAKSVQELHLQEQLKTVNAQLSILKEGNEKKRSAYRSSHSS